MTARPVRTGYLSPFTVHGASPLVEPNRAVLHDIHTPYDYCNLF